MTQTDGNFRSRRDAGNVVGWVSLVLVSLLAAAWFARYTYQLSRNGSMREWAGLIWMAGAGLLLLLQVVLLAALAVMVKRGGGASAAGAALVFTAVIAPLVTVVTVAATIWHDVQRPPHFVGP